MSFKAVWGFDPDEVKSSQTRLRGKKNACDASYDVLEEMAARIPLSWEQVDELWRMFRR